MTATNTKQCSKCKRTKSLSEFYKDSRKKKSGLRSKCKSCIGEELKVWRAKNKGKVRAQQKRCEGRRDFLRSTLKIRYSMTLSDYDQMFEEQEGNCAICGLPEINRRLSVDHDHKTNKIRKLLCGRCNRALGLVEENETTLQNMIKYIQRYKENANSIG